MTISVLHLIDSLDAGGAERMAVNLANNLPRGQFHAHLCATRHGGILEKELSPEVGFLSLNRRGRFDPGAMARLVAYIRQNKIEILHAHSSSLFLACLAAEICNCILIWHVHNGTAEIINRPTFLYKAVARKISAVYTVTRPLANWATVALHISPLRVFYLPNFVVEPKNIQSADNLPGNSGYRIINIANFRAQKDQIGLVRAFRKVAETEERAHLVLVGANVEAGYGQAIQDEIILLNLEKRVTWLGSRNDVPTLLAGCTIAVLSSLSEGFPLTLLEYGWAGLPVVATRVGECAEILAEGKAGILVEPGDTQALAGQILKLLDDPLLRQSYGAVLHDRVQKEYSSNVIMSKVIDVYRQVLSKKERVS